MERCLWGAEGSAISGIDLDEVRLHMVAPNPEFSGVSAAISTCAGPRQAPKREL